MAYGSNVFHKHIWDLKISDTKWSRLLQISDPKQHMSTSVPKVKK